MQARDVGIGVALGAGAVALGYSQRQRVQTWALQRANAQTETMFADLPDAIKTNAEMVSAKGRKVILFSAMPEHIRADGGSLNWGKLFTDYNRLRVEKLGVYALSHMDDGVEGAIFRGTDLPNEVMHSFAVRRTWSGRQQCVAGNRVQWGQADRFLTATLKKVVWAAEGSMSVSPQDMQLKAHDFLRPFFGPVYHPQMLIGENGGAVTRDDFVKTGLAGRLQERSIRHLATLRAYATGTTMGENMVSVNKATVAAGMDGIYPFSKGDGVVFRGYFGAPPKSRWARAYNQFAALAGLPQKVDMQTKAMLMRFYAVKEGNAALFNHWQNAHKPRGHNIAGKVWISQLVERAPCNNLLGEVSKAYDGPNPSYKIHGLAILPAVQVFGDDTQVIRPYQGFQPEKALKAFLANRAYPNRWTFARLGHALRAGAHDALRSVGSYVKNPITLLRLIRR